MAIIMMTHMKNNGSSVAVGHEESSGPDIFDRLERDPKTVAEPRCTFEAVDIDFKWNEFRLEQRAERRRQNFERQSTCLTRSDLEQGFPLFFRRFLVNKQANGAVAFV